ncbi:30S ribosomal protein S1 [Striga asiatica]|uniref:30S ribosomal protein S1 n=1 Tax=Striga asiatica TaxID=4170 RepID=A0A5A7NZW7_STRAF|nr:30S ribosomal protein S1 [Striga asiatica]
MYLLTAPSVSASGGFSFLSQSSNSGSASDNPLIATPSNLSCSLPSNKRPASVSASKVSVSNGISTSTVDGLDQSPHIDDPRRARMLADWEAARTYLEKGVVYHGKVQGYNAAGLRIRFYSLIGFIPFGQLSPSHSCKEPHKTIQEIARSLVGSVLSVKVVVADGEQRRLIFSEKKFSWSKFSPQLELGDIYYGRVGVVKDFGALVHLRFPDGFYHLTGIVHVSELSWDLILHAGDVLAVGDEVRVKIVHINWEESKIKLSIKQLTEDPFLETSDKVIPQDVSAEDPDALDESDHFTIEPLPGLDTIIEELLKENGIDGVKITGQGYEKRVFSQDLQLWLSNVQEIQLSTSLDQDGIKRALQRALGRGP